MQEDKSKSLITEEYDGKEITDSLSRKIRLRKPKYQEKYLLFKHMGDDSENSRLVGMMIPIIYVATIDGKVIESPRNHDQCMANLERLGEEGSEAVLREVFSNKMDPNELKK